MYDVDVLASFVKVLSEHKPGKDLCDPWLKGFDDAQESIAQLARETLELAEKYGSKVEGKDEREF